MEDNANSVVNTDENVEQTNSQEVNKGTQENENSSNATMENVASVVDYQKKFSESSKEAQRLFNEQKEKDAEIERLKHENLMLKGNGQNEYFDQNTDDYYPGFNDLDEDAKNNLINYTNTVTRKAKEELYKDPAIAFAKKQYNERVWDSAFDNAVALYPELAESKEEFKSKYYNVNNVPENIDSILKDVAKIHLFDKAKSIGAKEESEKNTRVDIERTTAGAKDPTAKRSLEDWNRMAINDLTQFRKLSKEFNEDLTSGKI